MQSKKDKKKTTNPKKKVAPKKKKFVTTGIKKGSIRKKLSQKQKIVMSTIIFCIGILMIFSSYAWFSTSLNVKIRQFDMIVSKNSGLSISFDGINFESFLDLSGASIIDDINSTYPNHTNQWADNGLIPVSSNGILNNNHSKFSVFATGGVRYVDRKKTKGYVITSLYNEKNPNHFGYFIAFDLFVKNKTGSPVSDNLYIGKDTFVRMDSDSPEEMVGLVNSIRIGFLKIGSVEINASANEIQNVSCNNNCTAVIYEPNAYLHSDLSIERALKYYVNLKPDTYFPTYGCIKNGGPIFVSDTVSGTANLNNEFFSLQKTMTENDIVKPLFSLPNGITKVRVYVWVEGQDIDSLETDSEGADITISIDLNKDTEGYDAFN